MTTSPTPEEQRRSPRKRTLLEARVVFNNRFSVIECTVRDMSATGAKIAFPHATPIPEEVELEIPKTGQSRRARVLWSDGKHHGLMFLDEVGSAAPGADAPTAIQAVIEDARRRIAKLAGVPSEAVRLKLEIDG